MPTIGEQLKSKKDRNMTQVHPRNPAAPPSTASTPTNDTESRFQGLESDVASVGHGLEQVGSDVHALAQSVQTLQELLKQSMAARPAAPPPPANDNSNEKLDKLLRLLEIQAAVAAQQQLQGKGGSGFEVSPMMMWGMGGQGGGAPGMPDFASVGAKAATAATLVLGAKAIDNMTKGMDRSTAVAIKAAVLGIAHVEVESKWAKALPVVGGMVGTAASGFLNGVGRGLVDSWKKQG